MSITLSLFLTLYLIILGACAIFACINVYHIIATASLTRVSFLVSAFVGLLMFFTLIITFALLADVDWSKEIILFGNSSNATQAADANFF